MICTSSATGTDRVEGMPKNPNRPKIKYKKVGRKPKPPNKTKEQKAATRLKKFERTFHVTPQKVITVLTREKGLLNQSAKELKMSRQTLVRYIEKYPACVDALLTARESMGDVAEKKLYELIEAGDVRCLLYYLSTVHRSRGYGIRAEDPSANFGNGPVMIETVNIVGIPSGTYLPKEVAAKDSMVIDHE
jgi:hypothetical protein